MTTKDDDGKAFAPDFDDEIVAGSCVTHAGGIMHEPTREAIEGSAGVTATEPEPASYDASVADDDGMSPEEPAPGDAQLDLPYDQEADQ